jgi:ribosomal peptide maturation radical SAM protein 1
MLDRLVPYDIIGISSTFFQNMPALALAKKLKERWPEKIVVLGGANCDDVMGTTLLEQFEFLDYVFSGEVDFSFPQFVKHLSDGRSVSEVSGVVYRDEQGKVARGSTAIPLEDMNSLPVPDYDDFVAQREESDLGTTSQPLGLALESSRGCWWGAKQHCVFCGLNANGMAFRQKDHDRFQSEVEQVVNRYRPRLLHMTDNILSTGYYKEFVGWAKQRDLGVDFFYEIKANVNRNQVEGLADAGISWIQPGIESFSSSTLSLMKKGVRGIQNVALLKYARDNGLRTSYGILCGFPGEDRDEYAKMAAQSPKLVHLEPPAGVWPAQYHRFSPMFHDPPTELRPFCAYFEIYPLPEKIIAGLAYYFEPTQPREFPYVQAIAESVKRWKQAWNPSTCTLTWENGVGDILIRDRRPGFAARDFRLVDHAVAVFHALDRPRQLKGVVRDLHSEEPEPIGNPAAARSDRNNGSSTRIERSGFLRRRRRWNRQQRRDPDNEELVSFTREEFAERPEACLRPLVEAGLLYVEEHYYVTLPVHVNHRAHPRQWHYKQRSWSEDLLSVLHLRRGPVENRRVGA